MSGEKLREEEQYEKPSEEMKRMIYKLVQGFKNTQEKEKQIDILDAIKIAIEMKMKWQWTTRKPELDFLEMHLRNYLNSPDSINKPEVSKKVIEMINGVIKEAKEDSDKLETE